MATTLNPYISFRGDARTAMEFYRSVFGGELLITPFSAFDTGQSADDDDLVMHSQLTTPAGFTLMASDTPSSMPYAPPAGVTVSVSGDDDAALEGYWNALAEGAEITMPLSTPAWGGRFGMLTDRFGVDWMIAIDPAEAA